MESVCLLLLEFLVGLRQAVLGAVLRQSVEAGLVIVVFLYEVLGLVSEPLLPVVDVLNISILGDACVDLLDEPVFVFYSGVG